MQLNTQQRKAVTTTDRPLLVLAGAGSGKTGVITQKIRWLIQQENLSPKHVFAVTFTNKAAAEMRERLSTMLSREETRQLSITTFHRLGLTILQRDGAGIGLRRGFTIRDQSDCTNALRDIISEHQLGLDERPLLSVISDWKNRFVTPDDAMAAAQNGREQSAAIAYGHYQSLLRACNSVDFDDLVCLPVELLTTDTELRDTWQSRVRHLLVDEYQDTNEAQYALIQLLVGKFGMLTAVGDDDQSIYSWRGANPENLNLLQKDYPSLEVIKLEQNYRSSQRILRCANAVIAENPHLFDKKLWSDLGLGDPIRVSACQNALDEADWVSADILSYKFRKKLQFRDIAILYRSNFQSRLFETALREKQIPYKISGGQSFFDRAEIKDIMAYLKLMVNPDDDMAFLRVVNTPRREIGVSTLEKLGQHARRRHCSLLHACHDLGLGETLNERARQKLQYFANWITAMADNAERGNAVAVIRQLLEDMDYEGWLNAQSASKPAAIAAWENVQELVDWIRRQYDNDETDSLVFSDAVSHMTLMDRLSRDDTDNGDQVQMMTLHAAKGLEFPYVYLVGAEENILPHRNSIEAETIEEERRLAYVGMTRAKQTLTFTWAATRQKFGETSQCEPTRFLEQLPPEDVNIIGDTSSESAVAINQAAGKETLDSLKALLAGK